MHYKNSQIYTGLLNQKHFGWNSLTNTAEKGYIEGILPKGPYLPCVSMAGRALLAGYRRHMVRLSNTNSNTNSNSWNQSLSTAKIQLAVNRQTLRREIHSFRYSSMYKYYKTMLCTTWIHHRKWIYHLQARINTLNLKTKLHRKRPRFGTV